MRKRFREYGFTVGELPIGKQNSITDVPGVKVGHITLHNQVDSNAGICTGVTAILLHSGNLFR